MKKEKEIFHPAFHGLQKKIKSVRERAEKTEPAQPKKPVPRQDDRGLFIEAMTDVEPISDNKSKIIPSPGSQKKPSHPAPDDEQAVMTHLYGLVKGAVDMDITFSDEYMEGSIKGLDRKIIKKLKRGEFPIQDYIDLHGQTRQEAELKVRAFLTQSRRLGHRCVLIVHGRGLNSPDSFPVLKEGLPKWLGRGPVKKIVLAFATARPYDGGTGAIYVLLKKR